MLALAHHRLGDADESRKWLDKTVEDLERGAGAKGASSFPVHIVDWLECQALRREAEAKIGKPAVKPDGKQ